VVTKGNYGVPDLLVEVCVRDLADDSNECTTVKTDDAGRAVVRPDVDGHFRVTATHARTATTKGDTETEHVSE